jgi:hypothetical protein
MISLYTILPRIACNSNKYIAEHIMESKTLKALLASWRKIEDLDESDIKYLPMFGKYLNTVLSNRNKIGLTPENTLTVKTKMLGSFHNYSGIVSLCQDNMGDVPHIRAIRKKMREFHNKKKEVNK